MKDKILISACLLGFNVRYNATGKRVPSALLQRWQEEGRLVIHCPELAAGLDTPRRPAELVNGQGRDVLLGHAQVRENDGTDVSQQYILAAWLALETTQRNHCRFAILTEGSPTCGSQAIYDGSFRGKKVQGQGVAAALLRQHGIDVFSEYQLDELDMRLRTKEDR